MTDRPYELAQKIREELVFPSSGGTGTHLAVGQSVDMLEQDRRDNSAGLVLIINGPPSDVDATRQVMRGIYQYNCRWIVSLISTIS